MKKLTVGFSTHKSLFSWLIRVGTASKVSHTYIRIPTDCAEDIVFQASQLSVNYCNYFYFCQKNQVIEEYEVEVSDEQALNAELLRVIMVGKPYSIKQIFGFAYVIIMHAFGKKVSNPLVDGDHSFICAELVARCIGLENPENMSQEDVRRWCEKNAKRIK